MLVELPAGWVPGLWESGPAEAQSARGLGPGHMPEERELGLEQLLECSVVVRQLPGLQGRERGQGQGCRLVPV